MTLLQESLLQACKLQRLLLVRMELSGCCSALKWLAKAGMPLYSMTGGYSKVSAVNLAGEGRLAAMQHSVM